MSYRYTEDERQFIRENYEIKGCKYCAQHLNRKSDSIFHQASKMGIKRIFGYDKLNLKLLENINNPEVAYFLGLFWADGSIYHYTSNNTNHYHTRLEIVKTDMDDIENIIDYMGKWSKRTRKRGHWQEVAVYTVSSKPVYEKFVELGYLDKSKIGPEKILSLIPEDLHFMFWRGFFDGDGSISYSKNFNIIKFSGSIELKWKSLTTLCESLGISYGLYYDKTKGNTSSCISIQTKIGIAKFIDYAYQSNLEIGFSRKRTKCSQFKVQRSL